MNRHYRFFILAFFAAFLAGAVPCAFSAGREMVWDGRQWVKAKPPKPGTPDGDLAEITSLIDAGENKQAVKAVEKFLIIHAASPVCEEAINLAGTAEMNRGRYWSAYQWYERQITNYPNGAFFERALDREFQIADAFLQGRKRRALKIFKISARDDGIEILMRIASQAPGSDLGERALLRVADYHYDRQEYEEAIAVYDEFVKSNPQSRRKPYAMLRAAKASLLSFRGVQWDDTPLLNAAVRFKVFAQAYPQAGKKENIAGILAEIRETRAHKVYHTGTFYERTHSRASAIFYYKKVMQDFPYSEWADKAKQKLELLEPIKLDPRFEQTPASPAEQTAQKPEKQPEPSAVQPAEKQPGPETGKTSLSEAEQIRSGQTGRKDTEPIRLEELTK